MQARDRVTRRMAGNSWLAKKVSVAIQGLFKQPRVTQLAASKASRAGQWSTRFDCYTGTVTLRGYPIDPPHEERKPRTPQ
jgi:hypothetical protein